ncbi:hypothetical protein [Streptomyces sp. SID13031]|uniref:hypothetical protein n=1 Tax=Streptomyces sp. SID13031 TaxID=2706046 RepID=UPI0013CDBFEE|nr:hypothetical protein [Streptomyces sp. SID13031]NEA31334.1 hypothetical protein [Streptomyces sp. SID13031]
MSRGPWVVREVPRPSGQAGTGSAPYDDPPPERVVTSLGADQDAVRRQGVERLIEYLPGLTLQQATDALKSASCDTPQRLKVLNEHLGEFPESLLTASSQVPTALVKLAYALRGHGRHDVALPICARCGEAKRRLASVDGTGGRLCERCAQGLVQKQPCAWCGRLQRVEARRPEGGICSRCHQADPSKHEPCATCGRTRRIAHRLTDGSGLCQACGPRRVYVCSGCGATAPAHKIGEQGPVCETCYRRPERPCGACGQTARIYHRATAHTPDLCDNCYQGIEAACTVCDRTRFCRRNRSTGDLVCDGCRPEPQQLCSFCHRTRRIRALWPAGAACRACYQTVRATPAPCTDCTTVRVLIGKTPAGDRICGPCAGVDIDYTCRACEQPGDFYVEGTCDRCLLKERIDDLLTGPDDTIDARLEPLHQALQAVPRPRSTLKWLKRCPAARLLVALAQQPDLINHDHLDRSPHTQAAHYLRGILVRTGVLAERDEHLERIGPWADRLLIEQPQHAHLIRPFTHWYLLPRARRRARQRPFTTYSAQTPRAQVRAALDLLNWIHDHDTTLDRIDQHDIDQWLSTGPSSRYHAALFLRWATSRHLTAPGAGLTVPMRRTKAPGPFLDPQQQTAQLHRCIHDTALPLDIRVAGALILLFGVPVSRITTLTTKDININDKSGPQLRLTLGNGPCPLATHTRRPHPATARRATRPGRRQPGSQSRHRSYSVLVPGMIAGRPSNPIALTCKLNRHGITAIAARNTARRALAEQLPASVLADLLGINVSTAISWARQTKTDWTTYIAER